MMLKQPTTHIYTIKLNDIKIFFQLSPHLTLYTLKYIYILFIFFFNPPLRETSSSDLLSLHLGSLLSPVGGSVALICGYSATSRCIAFRFRALFNTCSLVDNFKWVTTLLLHDHIRGVKAKSGCRSYTGGSSHHAESLSKTNDDHY